LSTYSNEEQLRRLRWKCRRGMLELDLILLHFLDQHYAKLSAEQQVVFEQLLEFEDPLLQQWFMRQAEPQDKALAAMIEYINTAME